jgi:hypothetical protein
MEQEKVYPIRPYAKSELAQAYAPDIAPHSALNRFSHWLKYNKSLSQELSDAGYHTQQRLFTALQVEIIFRYLGEP